uniref:Uncharacterized protein n=1 Tax=viral metagenome TaxID=1070528 RepID=A0A6H2A243_9ZZZZ
MKKKKNKDAFLDKIVEEKSSYNEYVEESEGKRFDRKNFKDGHKLCKLNF